DEGALPLQVITATQMKSMGVNSTEDLLRQLSANTASADNAVSSNTTFSAEGDRLGGGGAYANLRGLGPTGTLVLLDGRRLSNQGLSGGSVDLNAIPFEMIDRVEVLKDGASAIYGTDAIGGVINFILKKDYTGLSVSSTVSSPLASGGGQRRKVSVAGGFGTLAEQGFNVMGSISADDNKILRGIDRSWATGFQPDRYLVPDTSSAPGFANILPAANTALPATGTTIGTGTQLYTGLNALALNGQCASQPFGVPQQPNIGIFPGYTVANATYRCGTDYGRQYMLAVPTKNLSGVLRGTAALGRDATGFIEFVGSRVKTQGEYTPFQFSTTSAPTSVNAATNPGLASAFTALGLPLTLANGGTALANYPVNGPFYQNLKALFGANQFDPTKPIAYRLRMNDWGNRTNENVSTNKRFAAGVEGTFRDFDYKATLSHGEAEGHTNLLNGYADANKLVALLASGKYNPFLMPGQAQTAEAQQLVADSQVRGRIQGGKTKVDEANVTVSGKAFTLPAGEVDFALGVNGRKESYEFSGTQNYLCISSFTAANLGQGANPVMGCTGNSSAPDSSRKVGAVFGELYVPLLKNLEMQLAARYDRYSRIGGTTNPKVALKFTPTKDLLFRASASSGFRAPTPQQLNLGRQELDSGSTTFADPKLCPNPSSTSTDPNCSRSNVTVYTGGNQNLKPETSRQWSAGMVFSPIDSLQASVDYWKIKLSDRIHNLTYTQELNNYNLFADNFVREPGTDRILAIQAGWINAGTSTTQGLDFTLQHNLALAGGKLSTTATATKMISAKEALLKGQPLTQYVGIWTNSTLYQRWKGNISTTYKLNDWSTTLTANYSAGYQDETHATIVGSTNPVNRDIASQTTFNLFTTYTGWKNVTLSGGLINVFDRAPAFTWHNVDNVIGAGWDPRVADPRGRTAQITAKYSFF
ncbi:MAG: TonB-dependent receptor, partial [Burkholderiaceae bacterium]